MQTLIKRRQSRYERFINALNAAGFRDYPHYLASEAWRSFNAYYRGSDMPQKCLVCGSTHFILHHVSYDRVGAEMLSDVVPLCGDDHHRLHQYLAQNPKEELGEICTHLTKCFGIEPLEAESRVRHLWTQAKRERSAISKRKKCTQCNQNRTRRGEPICRRCQQWNENSRKWIEWRMENKPPKRRKRK